jgi:hypothetical protein
MTSKAKLSAVSSATRAVASLGEYGVRAASFALAYSDAEAKRIASLIGVNNLVAEMREAGIKSVGRNSKKNGCPIAIDFHAALVAGGIKATTANNYLTTLKKAVETGKEIKEWNSQRADAKNAKAKKEPRENPALDALVKLLNTAGGVELLHSLGVAFEEMSEVDQSLVDVVIDYLASEGITTE